MNFVQYQDGCATVPDDSASTGNSDCLRAAWDFRKAAERASSMGLTCLPAERTHFILNMYSDCFGRCHEIVLHLYILLKILSIEFLVIFEMFGPCLIWM